jgi:BirA family biotin operon repressor/biotin-[acetyl-CoA-carboxylase] ligase
LQDQPIINPLGQPFIELPTIDSTNNYALASIRKGTGRHGTAYFAHEQTDGKGQRGRKWEGEKGAGIALSIIIQPGPLLISGQFHLSACMALALQQFFSLYAGNDTRIKWPNDLYWQDRKAGGILIENIISGNLDLEKRGSATAHIISNSNIQSGWKWSVAGIGININQTRFPPDLPNPVSLKQITGKEFSPVLLAKELCSIAEHYLQRFKTGEGFTAILNEYNSVLYKLNEPVKLKKGSRVFTTVIKGVSSNGELITQNEGVEERFGFGEIVWNL